MSEKATKAVLKIQETIAGKDITVVSVISIIVMLMEAAEKFIRNTDRQQWVLDTASHIVKGHPGMSEDERTIVCKVIDLQGPMIIDTVVLASKGILKLNKSCKCCK